MMKKLTEKKAFEIAEKYDWEVVDLAVCGITVPPDVKQYEFRKYSPAGEDFSFSIDVTSDTDIATEVERYANDFDEEEHYMMWYNARGNVRGVPDLKTLMEDANGIKELIQELALALRGIDPEHHHASPASGMSLEQVLRDHFVCKTPARNDHRFRHYEDSEGVQKKSGLSVKGEKAYSKLSALIYDLGELLPEEIDADSIMETLDDMVQGYTEGLWGRLGE